MSCYIVIELAIAEIAVLHPYSLSLSLAKSSRVYFFYKKLIRRLTTKSTHGSMDDKMFLQNSVVSALQLLLANVLPDLVAGGAYACSNRHSCSISCFNTTRHTNVLYWMCSSYHSTVCGISFKVSTSNECSLWFNK